MPVTRTDLEPLQLAERPDGGAPRYESTAEDPGPAPSAPDLPEASDPVPREPSLTEAGDFGDEAVDVRVRLDNDTIVLPKFEPLHWEALDDGVTPPAPRPPRDRRPLKRVPLRAIWPALLAVLVVLQAGPSFLWIKSRMAGSAPAAAPAGTTGAEADHEAAVPDTPSQTPSAPPAVAGRSAVTANRPPEPPAAGAQAPKPEQPAARREAAPRPQSPPPAARTNTPPPAQGGTLSVAAPVAMQVYSGGKLIGTTDGAALALPAGSHDLEFVSDEVAWRTSRRVAVENGRTTSVRLEAPAGTVNINAAPWAEVWIDDRRIGETPIGNFRAPVGWRQVRFRHPELGERRATVLVTLDQTARVSVDLRQK